MKNKGFTLIELLVVIAIIGILSSVVLASLNSARNKGADAAVKSNLANIRPQAEIVYDAQGCYGDGAGSCITVAPGACNTTTADSMFAEATVAQQINAAKNAVGASSFNACASNTASGGAWAVVQQLKSDSLAGWCVDSRGIAKQSTAASNAQASFTALVNASGQCI